jgi:hypothetical protein
VVRGSGWCGAGKGGEERVDNQVVRDKKNRGFDFFLYFCKILKLMIIN